MACHKATATALAVLTGLFILVYSLGIGEMWLFGHHGWTGSRRGIAAINYDRHGFIATRFGPVENYGPAEPEQFDYYWHHPVLINVLVGVSFKLFGPQEWAARLVPIALSFISLLLLFALTRRLWGVKAAFVVGVVFLFLPLSGIYGKFVNHEPLVLAPALGLAWLRLSYECRRRLRTLITAGALTLVGCFGDWPFFFLLAAYGVVELAVQIGRPRERRALGFFVVVAVVATLGLLAVLLHLDALRGGGSFTKLISDRTTGSSGDFSGWSVIWQRREWYLELLTPLAIGAGVVWTLSLVPRWRRSRSGDTPEAGPGALDAVAGVFLLGGGAWTLVFAQGAYVHEYWVFFLIPFLSISSAWCMLALSRLVARLLGGFAGGVALALLLALFAAWGGSTILARQSMPSDVGREQPEFRFRFPIFASFVAERTAPDERLLIQDNLHWRFQTGFYLDRNYRRISLDERFRFLRPDSGERFLLIDRRHLPGSERSRILRYLSERYPITFFDRFCLIDLAPDPRSKSVSSEEDRPTPSIKAYRLVFEEPSWAWRWFVSRVYPPYRVEPSPADALTWALALGADDEAQRIAKEVTLPPAPPPEAARLTRHFAPLGAVSAVAAPKIYELEHFVRDTVAYHNASLLLGRPTAPALEALAAALDPVLPTAVAAGEGIAFGDQATLLFSFAGLYQGARAGKLLVLRADRDGTPGLRAWMHRRVAPPGGDSEETPRSERVWHNFEPAPEVWRRGMLYTDLYAFPAGFESHRASPGEAVFFLDRESRKRTEVFQAPPAREEALLLGHVGLARPRAVDSSPSCDWIDTMLPGCGPPVGSLSTSLPGACREALRGVLEPPRGMRVEGRRAALNILGLSPPLRGLQGGVIQLYLEAEEPLGADWRIRLALSPSAVRPPRIEAVFSQPLEALRTSRWRPGQIFVVSFPVASATAVSGIRWAWLSLTRETWSPGGRLPVTVGAGADSNTAILPLTEGGS